MSKPFIMYGWHLSYFAGKVRCYLAYKGIPFVDQPVDWYTLTQRIKRETGAVVMPVLRTPEDEWIQDSSIIIERMEERFPALPVVPTSPVQRFAASLIEAWGDEWWMPIAMHTRWSYPENFALFEHDAGNALLPHFPGFMKRLAVAQVAKTLRGYLHVVGIRPEQTSVLENWTHHMLDLLDAHFAAQPFLLGGHPTLADYGLVGTMYGHLGRDPWPAREMIAPRKRLRAWIDRMAAPHADNTAAHGGPDFGPLLADDALAETLAPILRILFAEFTSMIEGVNQQVRAVANKFPAGKPLPRSLGDVVIPTGAGVIKRAALPFMLWKAQRVLDVYRALSVADQAKVARWVGDFGGEAFLALDLPRVRRVGLRIALES